MLRKVLDDAAQQRNAAAELQIPVPEDSGQPQIHEYIEDDDEERNLGESATDSTIADEGTPLLTGSDSNVENEIESIAVAASSANLSLHMRRQQEQLQQQQSQRTSRGYGSTTTTNNNNSSRTTDATTGNTKYHRRSQTTGEMGPKVHPGEQQQPQVFVEEEGEDDEEYMTSDDDDEDDEEEEERERPLQWWEKVRNAFVTCFFVVANVENLWDSPATPNQPRHHSTSLSSNSDSYRRRGRDESDEDMGSTTAPSSSGLYNSDVDVDHRSIFNSNRARNNTVVLFWFVVLATSYATERSTFKLLVDRIEPFRLMSAQFVTACHAALLCLGMLVERFYCRSATGRTSDFTASKLPLGIPLVDVVFMALLDSISLLIVFLTGPHVPPTLTVILVQFTIPLTAFLTQFIHPDGRFHCIVASILGRSSASADNLHADTNDLTSSIRSGTSTTLMNNNNSHHQQIPQPPPIRGDMANTDEFFRDRNTAIDLGSGVVEGAALPGWGGLAAEHVWGSLILSLAVLLASVPALYSLADPDFFIYADKIPLRTAVNTLLYVASCIPAAASQLYKEHVFLQHRQPVNMNYLNLLLSLAQVVIAMIVTPLLYTLQGMGSTAADDWTTLYASSDFRENYVDSLKCLFNVLSKKDQEDKYADDARCNFAFGLVLFHCFAIITVGVAVDKIVNAGATKVMYRGISAGIIVAVVCMRFYDLHLPDFNYGPIISSLNLVCLLLLILGSEVYHRVSLQESTFETVYAEVHLHSYD